MLSDSLKEARLQAGLSQLKVSKITGIPQENISYWERGKSIPNALQAYAISKACGVSLEGLIEASFEGQEGDKHEKRSESM